MEIHQKLENCFESVDFSALSSPYLPKTFSQWRLDLFSEYSGDLHEFIQIVDYQYLPKFLKKISSAYQNAILSDPSLSDFPKSEDLALDLVRVLTEWSVELELAVDLIDRSRVYKLYEIPHGYQNLFKELKDEWRNSETYSHKIAQFALKYLLKATGHLKDALGDSIKGNIMQNLFQSRGSILVSICYAYFCGTMPWPIFALFGTQCTWIFSSVIVNKVGEKVCEKIESVNFNNRVKKLKQQLEGMISDLMCRNEISKGIIWDAVKGGESGMTRLAEHFNMVLNHHRVRLSYQGDYDEDVFVAENAEIREEDGWIVVQPPKITIELVEDWMVIE